jgi:hypothetical protein
MPVGRYFVSFHNDCFIMDEDFFTIEQKNENVEKLGDGF